MFWLEPYAYPIASYLTLCSGTLFNTAVNFGELPTNGVNGYQFHLYCFDLKKINVGINKMWQKRLLLLQL